MCTSTVKNGTNCLRKEPGNQGKLWQSYLRSSSSCEEFIVKWHQKWRIVTLTAVRVLTELSQHNGDFFNQDSKPTPNYHTRVIPIFLKKIAVQKLETSVCCHLGVNSTLPKIPHIPEREWTITKFAEKISRAEKQFSCWNANHSISRSSNGKERPRGNFRKFGNTSEDSPLCRKLGSILACGNIRFFRLLYHVSLERLFHSQVPKIEVGIYSGMESTPVYRTSFQITKKLGKCLI